MPWLLNRISFSAAIIAVSILVHLGFVGAIVFAERRKLPPSDLRSIDVDIVRPEELEPRKEEPPKPPELPKHTEQTLAAQKPTAPSLKKEPPVSKPAPPQEDDPPPPEQKQAARPEMPQGGPVGEGKSKLTPEEIFLEQRLEVRV